MISRKKFPRNSRHPPTQKNTVAKGRERERQLLFSVTVDGYSDIAQRHRKISDIERSATSKDQRHRSATLKLEATSQSANHPSQHNKNLIYGLRKAPSKPSSSFGASMSRIFTSTVALQTVVKTAVDQTTSTIPVAVLVPLCRRTHLSGAWIANIANFRSNNCVYPGCQTHINCKRDQIICDAIAIIRPGSH